MQPQITSLSPPFSLPTATATATASQSHHPSPSLSPYAPSDYTNSGLPLSRSSRTTHRPPSTVTRHRQPQPAHSEPSDHTVAGLSLSSLGLSLLSRVKPSDIFLKSIPKQLTGVEVVFPSSLNPRLVRRRLRHMALRGTIVYKNYFYGLVTLLPVTSAFAVLPLPNVPFFWMLFRTYSHWRALKHTYQPQDVDYGGIKAASNQPAKNSSQSQVAPSSSTAIVLSGPESSKKIGTQSDLSITPAIPKSLGDGNLTAKSTAAIPAHGTSDRWFVKSEKDA